MAMTRLSDPTPRMTLPRALLSEALRLARYGGPEGKTDYFYIWTTEGVGVMHPFKPEWDGQDMLGKVNEETQYAEVQSFAIGKLPYMLELKNHTVVIVPKRAFTDSAAQSKFENSFKNK